MYIITPSVFSEKKFKKSRKYFIQIIQIIPISFNQIYTHTYKHVKCTCTFLLLHYARSSSSTKPVHWLVGTPAVSCSKEFTITTFTRACKWFRFVYYLPQLNWPSAFPLIALLVEIGEYHCLFSWKFPYHFMVSNIFPIPFSVSNVT